MLRVLLYLLLLFIGLQTATAQTESGKKKGSRADRNWEAGRQYLEENRKQPGVITTLSGLQYTVIQKGSGRMPTGTNSVTVQYTGTHINGKEFETTRGDAPATFRMDEVIPGFQEVLKLMPIGSMYRVVIPSELAYGEKGSRNIGPNETLIFEMELLAVE